MDIWFSVDVIAQLKLFENNCKVLGLNKYTNTHTLGLTKLKLRKLICSAQQQLLKWLLILFLYTETYPFN